MAGPFYVDAANLLPLLAALLCLGLAFWLLVLNRRRPVGDPAPARALSVLLLAFGFNLLFSVFSNSAASARDVSAARTWSVLYNLPSVWTDLAGLYFLCVYPRRRTFIGTTVWGPALLLGIGMAITAVLVADPRLFQTTVVDASGVLIWEHIGPLYALQTFPAFATMSLIFLRDHLNARPPRPRGTLLASIAFGAGEGWFLGTVGGFAVVLLLGLSPSLPLPTGYPILFLLQVVADLVVFSIIGVLLAAARRKENLRQSIRHYAITVSVGMAIGIGVASSAILPTPVANAVLMVWVGIVSLFLAGLLTYVVARHRLLNLDARVRWTISRGTLAAIFLAVFFIVTGLADAFAEQFIGSNSWVLGGVAAGMLLFALAPLQHAAERLARRAVPEARPVTDLSHEERLHAYLDLARVAWTDGVLDKNERAMLDALQSRLGLTDSEARDLERRAAH